jgi:small subunit ribosomal protein S2
MPSLRELLEVGAHIGHKKEYSHPAARRFIFTVKEGVMVLNVEKTIECLGEALKFLKQALGEDGTILFVGTKAQAKEAVYRLATALGQPYVTERWLGGTLTNFETVKKSLIKLAELEKKINDPSFDQLTKRERSHLKEKHVKLTQVFEGMAKLTRPPDALFVVDAKQEEIAILEAERLNIPVVALMDTNANPALVDYPIPANDESKQVIELILEVIAGELGKVKVEKFEQSRKAEVEQEEKGDKLEKEVERPKRKIRTVKAKRVTKRASKTKKSSAKTRKSKK